MDTERFIPNMTKIAFSRKANRSSGRLGHPMKMGANIFRTFLLPYLQLQKSQICERQAVHVGWGWAVLPYLKVASSPIFQTKSCLVFYSTENIWKPLTKGVVQVKHCILRSRKEISVSLSAVSGETISATPADFATFPQRQRFFDGFSLPNYL